jgi:hypothetical protein
MYRVVMRGLDPHITWFAQFMRNRTRGHAWVTAVDGRAPEHRSRFREPVRKATSNHGENPVAIAMLMYIRRSR